MMGANLACNQFEYKATQKAVNEDCVFKANINLKKSKGLYQEVGL